MVDPKDHNNYDPRWNRGQGNRNQLKPRRGATKNLYCPPRRTLVKFSPNYPGFHPGSSSYSLFEAFRTPIEFQPKIKKHYSGKFCRNLSLSRDPKEPVPQDWGIETIMAPSKTGGKGSTMIFGSPPRRTLLIIFFVSPPSGHRKYTCQLPRASPRVIIV